MPKTPFELTEKTQGYLDQIGEWEAKISEARAVIDKTQERIEPLIDGFDREMAKEAWEFIDRTGTAPDVMMTPRQIARSMTISEGAVDRLIREVFGKKKDVKRIAEKDIFGRDTLSLKAIFERRQEVLKEQKQNYQNRRGRPLTPKRVETITALYYGGMSAEKIADHLRLSLKAVRETLEPIIARDGAKHAAE